jgi:hypothetical protein
MTAAPPEEYCSILQQDGGDKEGQQKHQQLVSVHAVAVGSHRGQSDDHDANLPVEAPGLTWKDTFFADNNIHDVIAVFDVDYIKNYGITSLLRSQSVLLILSVIFHVSTGVYDIISGIYILLIWVPCVYLLSKCFTKMSKGINGLHVAVTKEGIRTDMNGAYRTMTIVSTTS